MIDNKKQFSFNEGQSLKPEYKRFRELLATVPDIFWQVDATANDILEKSEENEIKDIYEIGSMIIRAADKIDRSEQVEEWRELREKAQQLTYNIEIMFPEIIKTEIPM